MADREPTKTDSTGFVIFAWFFGGIAMAFMVGKISAAFVWWAAWIMFAECVSDAVKDLKR